MNIVVNEPLIRRNSQIAKFAPLIGLLVLGGGMYVSLTQPELYWATLGALIVGFILSQVGIYYVNRWGRRPRPDELLNVALKGLDGRYTLYHYTTPVSHLLVGPSGLWILMPRHQRGVISYAKGRWHQKGGNLYLKIFAQESLGRPDLEVAGEIESLQKLLKEKLPEEKIPPIQTALVFTHPKTEVKISDEENPPAETVLLDKLKNVVRKVGKANPLSQERIIMIQDAIGPQVSEKVSE